MTRISCNAYVPPGFIDSGWASYTCYVDSLLDSAQALVCLRRCIALTEITKIQDFTVTQVLRIPNGALVVLPTGEYSRTQGWDA